MTGIRRENISLAISGSGGTGVLTAGELLLRTAAKMGFYGLLTRSVGPQIRGGESAALVRLAHYPVETHDDHFHLLLAVDWQNYDRFAGEIHLGDDVFVITDAQVGNLPAVVAQKVEEKNVLRLPLHALARETGSRVNMVALGLVGALLAMERDILQGVVERFFGDRKRPQFIAPSLAALEKGWALAQPLLETCGGPLLATPARPCRDLAECGERWLISGNQAVATGFLHAGGRFAVGYPITPATDLLEWLAPRLPRVGGLLVQAEDELAAINMALGASFGGVPAMTATSGPGLSLMVEGIGLGVMAEIPVLIVDVQRIGPSTGIPTKSEQGDLLLALHGAHGDAPRLVLAPDCVADGVHTTAWALHLSERLQCPAVLLSDQKLGQMLAITDVIPAPPWRAERKLAKGCTDEDAPYARYALTDDGVSPMALPGTEGCMHTIDGLEHDEHALPSTRVEDHAAQLEKRRRKLAQLEEWPDADMAHWAESCGTGEVAVITWGSSAGAAQEAVRMATAEGLHARHISLRLLWPPQRRRLARLLAGVTRLIVVEQDHAGQFLHYLRAHYDLPAEVISCRQPGPRPITPGQVLRAVRQACATAQRFEQSGEGAYA